MEARTPASQIPSARLVLVLERGSTPLRGSVADPLGRQLQFTGWLGLMSALEQILAGTR